MYWQILLCSLIIMALGAYYLKRGNWMLKNGERAQATIIDNIYKTGPDLMTGAYYPVVEFVTDKSETIKKQLKVGVNPARPVGQKLMVIYDPHHPTDLITNERWQANILPKMCLAVGALGAVIAILGMFGTW